MTVQMTVLPSYALDQDAGRRQAETRPDVCLELCCESWEPWGCTKTSLST
jgi:hypothetical protein